MKFIHLQLYKDSKELIPHRATSMLILIDRIDNVVDFGDHRMVWFLDNDRDSNRRSIKVEDSMDSIKATVQNSKYF